LNAGFSASVEATKIVAPACKRILTALQPYLRGLDTGRLNNRLSNPLRQSLAQKKRLELSYLKGIELQRDHPLEDMLKVPYKIIIDKKNVSIEIAIEKDTVKPFNRLVSDYYFEAVLLYGDVNKAKALKTETVESALYPIYSKAKTKCVLSVSLPKKEDWCLLLKLSSLEGNEMAVHPKHYRMKVVGP
jgi:hypothetical protein